MHSRKTVDWSYLLLLPFLTLTIVPVIAKYTRMWPTFLLVGAWVFKAWAARRQVHLPRGDANNLAGAFIFLGLYTCLSPIYWLFGIGSEPSYEMGAQLAQNLVPLAIFHLAICNGRHRELRLLVIYCFGCLAMGATMTYFGEGTIVGGSRARTGSGEEAHDAFQAGIGSFGFVYGAGLLIPPLLFGMSFMERPAKLLVSTLLILILLASYRASYSILMIAIALGIILYAVSKCGFKQRFVKLAGVVLVASTVVSVALPQTLSFIAQPLRGLKDYTARNEYKARLTALADAVSGDVGTYVELRSSLYWRSFQTFLNHPAFGRGGDQTYERLSDTVGGHSTVFDTLGNYGLFGFTVYLLFFVSHYHYLRYISASVIGYKWWPAYYIFIFPATIVMLLNPFTGGPLLYTLCLYVPALPLLFRQEHQLIAPQARPKLIAR